MMSVIHEAFIHLGLSGEPWGELLASLVWHIFFLSGIFG